MPRHLCIHGHFYQPPREDPWLGDILPEDSAAPSLNWNSRITRESYAPLAWARRLDAKGRIAEIMNCYEWISFNAGPTLMRWLETADPSTYARMIEADRISAARWGHGNALAQIFHHIILPLSSQQDKKIETAWAIADFESRFGRKPEGMWLAESAADIASLEVLADNNITFTILAPSQAKKIRQMENNNWQDIHEGILDISMPYRAYLPSGKHIDIFFYNGSVSRAVAFERLLADGETFWQRLSHSAGSGLMSVCTDGETYGHHFTFGEMALAHVLGQAISGRDDVSLTNYAAYLAAHPPTHEVQIHEPSSWSCAHGVERWRSDCGCTDGGHPDWNQAWRGPLRDALDLMKREVDSHYTRTAADLFTTPDKALEQYGKLLTGSQKREAFADQFFKSNLDEQQQKTGWLLLAMQEQALSAYASCAWFFDEISRIEPVNAMTFALRAMELMLRTGGKDIQEQFCEQLDKAVSNKPEEGTGKDIFTNHVVPRQENAATLTHQTLLMLWAEKRLPCPTIKATMKWRNVQVQIDVTDAVSGTLSGTSTICWLPDTHGETVEWEWTPPDPGYVRKRPLKVTMPDGQSLSSEYDTLPRTKRQAIACRFMEKANLVRQEEFAAEAAHALPLFEPWTEAQHDQHLARHWRSNAASLAIAYLRDDSLNAQQSDQLSSYLKECGLSASGGREAIMEWVEKRLTTLIDTKETERAVIILRRLRRILPDADLWAVQNALWLKGPYANGYRELAGELGFTV